MPSVIYKNKRIIFLIGRTSAKRREREILRCSWRFSEGTPYEAFLKGRFKGERRCKLPAPHIGCSRPVAKSYVLPAYRHYKTNALNLDKDAPPRNGKTKGLGLQSPTT
jgi:hypothetical protein